MDTLLLIFVVSIIITIIIIIYIGFHYTTFNVELIFECLSSEEININMRLRNYIITNYNTFESDKEYIIKKYNIRFKYIMFNGTTVMLRFRSISDRTKYINESKKITVVSYV
jgi:hypothetical protein